jgi:hypothetical protein
MASDPYMGEADSDSTLGREEQGALDTVFSKSTDDLTIVTLSVSPKNSRDFDRLLIYRSGRIVFERYGSDPDSGQAAKWGDKPLIQKECKWSFSEYDGIMTVETGTKANPTTKIAVSKDGPDGVVVMEPKGLVNPWR